MRASLEEAGFFAGNPAALSLYEQLVSGMQRRLPPFETRVHKTQITFANPKVFACVSLKWKGCIVVTIGLPDRILSDRVDQAVEIRPGRWTLHIRVRSAAEVDEELLGWLMAASLFAGRNAARKGKH